MSKSIANVLMISVLSLLFPIYSVYLEEGFLHLENAIGLSIIEFYANKTINLQVSVEVRNFDWVYEKSINFA